MSDDARKRQIQQQIADLEAVCRWPAGGLQTKNSAAARADSATARQLGTEISRIESSLRNHRSEIANLRRTL